LNNNFKLEIRYRLLKILSQDTKLTQREMAEKMGISLGSVNYCLDQKRVREDQPIQGLEKQVAVSVSSDDPGS